MLLHMWLDLYPSFLGSFLPAEQDVTAGKVIPVLDTLCCGGASGRAALHASWGKGSQASPGALERIAARERARAVFECAGNPEGCNFTAKRESTNY